MPINAPGTIHLPGVFGPLPTPMEKRRDPPEPRKGPYQIKPIAPGPVEWATGVASTLADAAATSDPIKTQTSLIAGSGKWIPVAYGLNRFSGLITFARKRLDTGALVIDLTCCEGEIDAVTAVEINNTYLRAGCAFTVYRGLASQTVDGTVAAALTNSLPTGTYADALNGIAHVVLSLADAAYTAQEIAGTDITFRGRKIFDIRDASQDIMVPSTWKYSINAALIRADFLSSGNALVRGVRPRFGRGLIVNHAASVAAYNWCDTLVGVYPNQAKRGEFNGMFLNPQSDATNDEMLKTASMCFVDILGDTATLIPDMPRAPVFLVDDDPLGADNIFTWERIYERRSDTVPTVIEGSLPDISQKPWGTKKFRVVHPYVLTGQLPEVTENVPFTFCRSLAAAQRFATQRLNMKQLASRTWGVSGPPEMLLLQKGDLIGATHRIGMTNKAWVTDAVMDRGAGDVHVKLSEYDPAMFANNVITEPTTTGDGSLNCDTYPTISGFTASERPGWEPSGGGYTCVKRAQAVWTVAYYPCLAFYEVELSQGGTVLESTTAASASYVSLPLAAGSYTLRTRLVSTVPGMAPGAWSTTTVTITSAACMPAAPRGLRIVGTRSYHQFSSPPFTDTETRTIQIDAAISTVTHTEVWFGTASDSFGSASLEATLSGARTSVVYSVYAANGVSFYQWFTTFEGTTTPAGVIPTFDRPVMPEKVWIRFKNGSDVSDPVLVVCSSANLTELQMQVAGITGGFFGELRTLDGTFEVPAAGDTRVFTASSGGAPFATFASLAGTLTYSYLGGTSQQIDAGVFDSYGDPIGGAAAWQASRLYG